MNPEISYLTGLIGGDGNLSEKRISIIDENIEFHQKVIKNLFEKAFGVTPVISPMKTVKGKITYRSRINSKKVFTYFKNDLRIPDKEKTFLMKTPYQVMNSSIKVRAAYIRGWMDSEGWVTNKTVKKPNKKYTYPKIGFHVANKTIRDEIDFLLRSMEIKPSCWRYKNMYGLQIIGFEKVNMFMDKIGFMHPDKILKHSAFLRQNAAYNAQDNEMQHRKVKPIP